MINGSGTTIIPYTNLINTSKLIVYVYELAVNMKYAITSAY